MSDPILAPNNKIDEIHVVSSVDGKESKGDSILSLSFGITGDDQVNDVLTRKIRKLPETTERIVILFIPSLSFPHFHRKQVFTIL